MCVTLAPLSLCRSLTPPHSSCFWSEHRVVIVAGFRFLMAMPRGVSMCRSVRAAAQPFLLAVRALIATAAAAAAAAWLLLCTLFTFKLYTRISPQLIPSTHPLNPSPQPIPSLHVPTYAWSVLIDGGPVYQVANDTVAGGEQATQHASLPLLGNDFATASHRPQSRNKRCFFATGTHTHT